ncbi:hypothetical protein EDC04DRAFT_3142335 [Pisolithus marmoratus]|nr:hypothetical protein EDC04DRAFT_3142335 [Pisolithus marmoratus]
MHHLVNDVRSRTELPGRRRRFTCMKSADIEDYSSTQYLSIKTGINDVNVFLVVIAYECGTPQATDHGPRAHDCVIEGFNKMSSQVEDFHLDDTINVVRIINAIPIPIVPSQLKTESDRYGLLFEFERREHWETVEEANHRIEELEAQVAIREMELETRIRLPSQGVPEGDTVVVYPHPRYRQKSVYVRSRSRTRAVFVFWRATVHEIDRYTCEVATAAGQRRATSGMGTHNMEDILRIEEECVRLSAPVRYLQEQMDKSKAERKSRESELLNETEVLRSRVRRTHCPLVPVDASIAEESMELVTPLQLTLPLSTQSHDTPPEPVDSSSIPLPFSPG